MQRIRTIQLVQSATAVIEGAGVHLKRVFGFSNEQQFDPFLLLDDFRSDTPAHYLKGFPWHPHRGIETITYVTRGDVEHGDSLGNTGTISSGDVQWMTAGSGIIHQEMPRGDTQGAMHGFQLWANLPAAQKMMDPRYREVTAEQIPEVALAEGVRVKIIAGTVGTAQGPVKDVVIDPEYLDCTVSAGATFHHGVQAGYTVFLYVIGGKCLIDRQEFSNRTLVLFADGDCVELQAGDSEARFLLISGKPLKEPIAWRGPIVMNSEEELDLAFQEYHAGTFIKHKQ